MPIAAKASPALLAANERLLELRAQARAERLTAVSPAAPSVEAEERLTAGCVHESVPAAGGVTDRPANRVGGETGVSAAALKTDDGPGAGGLMPPWLEAETEPPTVADLLAGLPSTLPRLLPHHLGWGSESLSRVLRQVQSRPQADEARADGLAGAVTGGADHGRTGSVQGQSWPQSAPGPGSSVSGLFTSGNGRFDRHDTPGHTGSNGADGASAGRQAESSRLPADVKLYPDIGLAMLRQEQTAAGRLWLLLRGLDGEGRGWLRVANIRQLLTKKTSKTYLCGWRQLRNLLREGDDLYWQRDEGRLWLRSAAKVAYGLGVERLSGRPVALPFEALVNGIGRFRAELYAAFHSSRMKTAPDGQTQVAPIARETLTNLSGVGETTQRRYEEQLERTETAVAVQSNYAIGNKASEAELEEKGWTQGQALFVLEDFRGRQGPKGEQYVAWQLPNSYTGSHRPRPKGRQRRINRELKDLVMKGMPGNEGQAVEAAQADSTRVDSGRVKKLYYPNGKLAAQAFNRRKVDSCYWRQGGGGNGRFGAFSADHTGTGSTGRFGLWQHLALPGGASQ